MKKQVDNIQVIVGMVLSCFLYSVMRMLSEFRVWRNVLGGIVFQLNMHSFLSFLFEL